MTPEETRAILLMVKIKRKELSQDQILTIFKQSTSRLNYLIKNKIMKHYTLPDDLIFEILQLTDSRQNWFRIRTCIEFQNLSDEHIDWILESGDKKMINMLPEYQELSDKQLLKYKLAR